MNSRADQIKREIERCRLGRQRAWVNMIRLAVKHKRKRFNKWDRVFTRLGRKMKKLQNELEWVLFSPH